MNIPMHNDNKRYEYIGNAVWRFSGMMYWGSFYEWIGPGNGVEDSFEEMDKW